ncbi:N-acetyltransferase [Phenylobacterium sp.]|jgi:putative acetyltransferase|uniref:GNAT family N-acetyltransferase n=1 Tax=Phenylobacterium sp. TaxID=1871053 RepID=UPI002F41AAA0
MIRHANASDHAAIFAVVAEAFGRPDEARLVEQLRADGDVVFELVAAEDSAVEGHILISRLWADSPALYGALAPLAVTPALQRRGLGAALVRSALEQAPEFGCRGVLVLGEPEYYGRFGFSNETAKGVRSPFSHLAAFQALALEEGAFTEPLTVAYPDAFGA